MVISYPERFRRARKMFWLSFAVLVILLAGTIYCAYCCLGKQDDPNLALLHGPPEFIVLLLVVAFAVYLRQVSTAAADLRDRIRGGAVWNYPVDRDYSQRKQDALDGTCEKLSVAAPFLILLSIVVALRIACDAVLRFPHPIWRNLAWAVSLADVAIAVWIFFLFFALAFVHWRGRIRDEAIRKDTRAGEKDLPPPAKAVPPTPGRLSVSENVALRPSTRVSMESASTGVAGGLLLLAGLLLLGRARPRQNT